MDFQTHSARKVSSKLLVERVEGCSFTCITSIAHRVVEIKTKKFIHTVIFFDYLLGTLINSNSFTFILKDTLYTAYWSMHTFIFRVR